MINKIFTSCALILLLPCIINANDEQISSYDLAIGLIGMGANAATLGTTITQVGSDIMSNKLLGWPAIIQKNQIGLSNASFILCNCGTMIVHSKKGLTKEYVHYAAKRIYNASTAINTLGWGTYFLDRALKTDTLIHKIGFSGLSLALYGSSLYFTIKFCRSFSEKHPADYAR